jgi:6-phosphogluconate dehydrogenase (decarboxylating)
MKLALVGLGYWGPNLLRVLKKIGVLAAAFDLDEDKIAKFVSYHIFGGQNYPGNFHHVMFDRAWLFHILKPLGLLEVYYEEEGSNFIGKYVKERK